MLRRIAVNKTTKTFYLEDSGEKFIAKGFNYDHDAEMHFIEDYWNTDWEKVVRDFRAMREMGGNVVRVHPQLGLFMDSPTQPNSSRLDRLSQLLKLAEETEIYIDLTGLGCYRRKDSPEWLSSASEELRWETQANYWRAVAGRCAGSPALLFYDLINEPSLPATARKPGEWFGANFVGLHYGHYLVLDPAGRTSDEIAGAWIARMSEAIRSEDKKGLISIGLDPHFGGEPTADRGAFSPETIAKLVDFLCVHIYPKTPPAEQAGAAVRFAPELALLERYADAAPTIIEEIFPLQCSCEDLGEFISLSKRRAQGWITFYWGKTAEEYRATGLPREKVIADWLDLFQQIY